MSEEIITGSGVPFGGPHSIIATSPNATRVFCGSKRNSSRNTVKRKRVEMTTINLDFILIINATVLNDEVLWCPLWSPPR